MKKRPEPKTVRQGNRYYVAEVFPPQQEGHKYGWAVWSIPADTTTGVGQDRAGGLADSAEEAEHQASEARKAVMEQDKANP